MSRAGCILARNIGSYGTYCRSSITNSRNLMQYRLFHQSKRRMNQDTPPKQSSSSSSNNNRSGSSRFSKDNSKVAYYMGALAVFVFGVSYASVPLYKVFCTMTGFGGTTQVATEEKARKVSPVEGSKMIRIYFSSNVHDTMPWKFFPTQQSVKVVPGETALAFYTVKNKSKKAITGIATYNVHPPKAGLYFNKIQCFCFEEQRLNGNEEIDMPVFFFIDPDFVTDPAMDNVSHITLSYTFFKTGEEAEDEGEEVKVLKKEGNMSSSKTAVPVVAATISQKETKEL
jgi:cytochrome c oxidase assembly protein subunit 11